MAEEVRHDNDHGQLATTATVIGSAAGLGVLGTWAYNLFKRSGVAVEPGTIQQLVNAAAPLLQSMMAKGPGGSGECEALLAKIAKLESEKYTDMAVGRQAERDFVAQEKFYTQYIATRDELATTKAELKCLNEKLTTYELSQRELAALKAQNDDLKMTIVNNRVTCLEERTATGLTAVGNRVSGVEAAIAGITKTYIPSSNICTKNECGCNGGGNNQ